MSPRRTVVIGGLGGGGDVVLALMLARFFNIRSDQTVVVSFNKCGIRKDKLHSIQVKGALIKVPPNHFSSRRVFEDKIHYIEPRLSDNVYILCTRESFEDIVKGLDWIVEHYNPESFLHADIGGDSLIMGYEEKLGSYKIDTLARAALTAISKQYKLKSYLAVGCVGCEGGGTALNISELAWNLKNASNKGALIKSIILPKEIAKIGYTALIYGDSGMLPFFLGALRGLNHTEIHKAYLHGKYQIEPWHKCTYILDNQKFCELSPICKHIISHGKLTKSITKKYRKPIPNPAETLQELCDIYRKQGKHNIPV